MTIKMLENIEIDRTLELSIREFGRDFHSELHFKDFIDSTNKVALIARDEEQVIGILLVESLNKIQFLKKLNKNTPIVNIDEELNYIDTILVDKQLQKSGVGSQLLQSYFQGWQDDLQTVAIAWKNPDGLRVKPLFEKFGFKEHFELHNLWDTECNAGEYECAYKKGVCNCSGVLFVRE